MIYRPAGAWEVLEDGRLALVLMPAEVDLSYGVTNRPTGRVGGIRGLGEILADLCGDDADEPILPEPILTAVELTLPDADSLNLRNNVLHGITDVVRAIDAALTVQLALALALAVYLDPPAVPAHA